MEVKGRSNSSPKHQLSKSPHQSRGCSGDELKLSLPRHSSASKGSDKDLRFSNATSSPSCSEKSLESSSKQRDRAQSRSSDGSKDVVDRQDSKASVSSGTSPKVSRKYFTNWKQACDKTKDRTRELLKKWRTLPESEGPEDMDNEVDLVPKQNGEKGRGWSVHVWTTWVNRFSEDLECLDLVEDGPDATLSEVQTDKMSLFFSELLDHDRDDIISEQDFDNLREKLAHFSDWSTTSSEYHILSEVISEFVDYFIKPLPAMYQERPFYRRLDSALPPGHTSLEGWLARWALLLNNRPTLSRYPLFIQYFCKILFAVIDRDGSGIISKQALGNFYKSVVGLTTARVDEILDTAYNRMTSNEYLILDYSTFRYCYTNWLVGKNPNGPGQWVLVPPRGPLPHPPFPVDYSALNTEPDKLEPYVPNDSTVQTNRYSVIV